MDEFINRWQFVRSETLEILQSLSDEDLQFRPAGNTWQPLYYQFGCIIRTQLIYAEAARSGQMDFALFHASRFPAKADYQSVQSISSHLASSNKQWLDAVSLNTGSVVWPDGTASIAQHIARLAEHERLHHGQLISYCTLAGFELPPEFKQNWAL